MEHVMLRQFCFDNCILLEMQASASAPYPHPIRSCYDIRTLRYLNYEPLSAAI